MEGSAVFPDLKDKSVFITGGGSGIGASLTKGFIAQGAKVAFVQRSDASEFCDVLAAQYANRPLFISCDITNNEALLHSIDIARKANGPITVLVNNAAADTRHQIEGYTIEEWDRSLNINLRPHFFTAQKVMDDMKQAGGGSIINYSSISYLMGQAGYASYLSSKAGITGLTRALARELGPHNIRVNTLLPGWVLTDRQKQLWVTPEALSAHLEMQCLKREIEPDDMIEPTLFLASSASRMMTGQALVVDGGVVVTG